MKRFFNHACFVELFIKSLKHVNGVDDLAGHRFHQMPMAIGCHPYPSETSCRFHVQSVSGWRSKGASKGTGGEGFKTPGPLHADALFWVQSTLEGRT